MQIKLILKYHHKYFKYSKIPIIAKKCIQNVKSSKVQYQIKVFSLSTRINQFRLSRFSHVTCYQMNWRGLAQNNALLIVLNGSKIFTILIRYFHFVIQSDPNPVLPSSRDEHWTGLGLYWIRTLTNFIEFGVDPVCKVLDKSRIRTGFGLIYLKNLRNFCFRKVNFLDFIQTWISKLSYCLDYGWTWTELWNFRTGSGWQNMIVRSALSSKCFIQSVLYP